MTELPATGKSREVERYDPEKGLKTIAVAEAGERHWTRAKDATQLYKAIEAKIKAQAEYVVWRDAAANPRGQPKKNSSRTARILPAADPGDVIAHRWRKRLCFKGKTGTIIDKDKLALALKDAHHRTVRICEQQKAGTVRGTEGTGEFERYTPAVYIEASRLVLGAVDLDPATSEIAQRTICAEKYFTAETDGLKREWHGRVWLNPPYHRELMPAFIDKLIVEFFAGRTTAAIMLTNNCTDTDWFLAAAMTCNAICWTHGRIKFTDENGIAVLPTQGQAFFYFGPDAKNFESVFCRFGFGAGPNVWWKFDPEK
jgi:phage N-6-adenine-methyltransferase